MANIVSNPIIPSKLMRNAVTKTSDLLVIRLRHLVSLDEPKNGGPFAGLAARECVKAMAEAADRLETLSATPAPEPQPEVAAEPVDVLCPSCDGVGLDLYGGTTHDCRVCAGRGTVKAPSPSVVEEAVKAEDEDWQIKIIEQSETLDGSYALTLQLDGRDAFVIVKFEDPYNG